MLELLAIARLRDGAECFERRVFGAADAESWRECSDAFALVEPQQDSVERVGCQTQITDAFIVEVRSPIEGQDFRGEVSIAVGNSYRAEILSALHEWLPSEGYQAVHYQGGGFVGTIDNFTRWRWRFETKLCATPRISNDDQERWDEMLDEG